MITKTKEERSFYFSTAMQMASERLEWHRKPPFLFHCSGTDDPGTVEVAMESPF
jgi:hypothetical protein